MFEDAEVFDRVLCLVVVIGVILYFLIQAWKGRPGPWD